MIIDHRTYTVKHGELEAYINLFEQEALPLQLRYLGNLIGYFKTAIGSLNQVIHLWGYETMADMEARRAKRDKDPAWTTYKNNSKGMLIIQKNKIIVPTVFSPLK